MAIVLITVRIIIKEILYALSFEEDSKEKRQRFFLKICSKNCEFECGAGPPPRSAMKASRSAMVAPNVPEENSRR